MNSQGAQQGIQPAYNNNPYAPLPQQPSHFAPQPYHPTPPPYQAPPTPTMTPQAKTAAGSSRQSHVEAF